MAFFPEEEAKFAARGVQLHGLACWQDVLDEISQSEQLLPDEIATIQSFLQDPDGYQANS